MNNKINFTGFLYANCNGMTKNGHSTGIRIYRVTKDDDVLLRGLLRVKNTKNKIEARIKGAVRLAQSQKDSTIFVAVCENTPIGVIAAVGKTIENKLIYQIDTFATWGKDKRFFSQRRKNKILNAGKALLNSVLTEAQKMNALIVKVTSKQQSYSFYKKEGFVISLSKRESVKTNTKPMEYAIDSQNLASKLKSINMLIVDSKQNTITDKFDLDLGSSKIESFFQSISSFIS